MSKKYYSVAVGRKIGIFENWKDCKDSVNGFKNAVYKSFSNLEDANQFLFNFKKNNEKFKNELTDDNEVKKSVELDLQKRIFPIFVDGSFNKKNQKIGFGILIINDLNSSNWITISNKLDEIEYKNYKSHLNIAGEIIGTIKAIQFCIKNNLEKIKIYYDYAGIEKWVTKEWEAKSPISTMYLQFIEKNKEKIQLLFQKVRAHNNIEYNNIADELAKKSVSVN
ncbi:MAG: ribonuclease H family protein [Malacoplasma sp.]|nr:ribonuclease H family protein [Malacoplasma sp.]